MNKFFFSSLLTILVTTSCVENSKKTEEQSKQKIPAVKIESQIWMKNNLNVNHFRNGDSIPEAKNDKEWRDASKEKRAIWCYYGNDKENGRIFGKLYNWYAVVDERRLCPEGWHVPSLSEWQELQDNLGGERVAGAYLKSEKIWNGYNSYGFSALPGGYMDSGSRRTGDGIFDSAFNFLRWKGYWWSTTEYKSDIKYAHYVKISKDSDWLDLGGLFTSEKSYGYSVRCIKDY